jgi:hypothetical protein
MAIQNRMEGREIPQGTVAVNELKRVVSAVSYNIWKAQDALVKLHSMGILAYDGISVADLESKLRWVEEAQDGLEKEFAVQDLWR